MSSKTSSLRDRPQRATLTIAVLNDGMNVVSVLEAHAAQTPHMGPAAGVSGYLRVSGHANCLFALG